MMFTSNDYVPPYSITNQMVASIASISDKIGRISVTNDLENKPHLRRSNRIRSIHSSLKIVSLLNVMDHDTPYTRQTLMAYLGLSSTAKFRKKYLEPAMQLNLIRMTIPDKPTSRNQRYIKTSF